MSSDPKKVTMGKKSRAAGMRFEKCVGEDLKKKGWIVVKNPNNVIDNEFKQSKTKFNPFTKRPMMLSGGFPDYLIFREGSFDTPFKKLGLPPIKLSPPAYEIRGIEAKMDGKLDKIEKEKCAWLLKNNIFSQIFIAQKSAKRGKIEYVQFKK